MGVDGEHLAPGALGQNAHCSAAGRSLATRHPARPAHRSASQERTAWTETLLVGGGLVWSWEALLGASEQH